MNEVDGTAETLEADLVLLAMGFLAPRICLEALGVELDARSNYAPRTAPSPRAFRASSRPATAAAANRWSSGRSTKAAAPRGRSTSI